MSYLNNLLHRHQIDRLLKYQAIICSNLGVDSTLDEKKTANKKIALLDRLIRKVDRKFF
tara:strand:- start:33 stop:209 length:177 start_codon:yes stop_codon:yes gene_type:complete